MSAYARALVRRPTVLSCLLAFSASLLLALLIAVHTQQLPLVVGACLFASAALVDPLFLLGAALLLAPVDFNFLIGNAEVAGVNVNDALVFALVAAAVTGSVLRGWIRPTFALAAALAGCVATFVLLAPTTIVDLGSGLRFAGQLLAPVGAYAVARHARFRRGQEDVLESGSRILTATLVLAALLTLATLALGRSVETAGGEDATRFAGSLGNGSFAFFLLLPLVLTMSALSVRTTTARWATLAVVTLALVATLTRSALIAAALSLLYFSLFSAERTKVIAMIAVSIALGTVFVAISPDSLNRFRSSNSVSSNIVYGTLTGREQLWDFIWRTDVTPSPIAGSGLGVTAPIFAGQTTFRTGAGAVHNDYLNILAQVGFLGLAVYAAYLAALLFPTLGTAARERHARDGASSALLIRRAAPPLLLAFMIVSFFDNAAANFAHFGVPLFTVVGLARR